MFEKIIHYSINHRWFVMLGVTIACTPLMAGWTCSSLAQN